MAPPAPSVWSRLTRAWDALRGAEPARALSVTRQYDGAAYTRLNADWVAAITAPDDDHFTSSTILRARARDLERNSPLIARYTTVLRDQVIGPHGIALQARHRTNRDTWRAENDRLEAAWRAWAANPAACHTNGLHTFTELLQQIIVRMAIDGEAFLVLSPGDDVSPNGLSLALLDPDQIDPQFDGTFGGREIRAGIERDARGRRVAYWVYERHPQSLGGPGRRERVEADRLLHLFIEQRPGQARGVTWLAPVMARVKMAKGYQEAELVAARTASAKMGFITNAEAGGFAEGLDVESGLMTMDADPGMITELPRGKAFVPWDPQHPTAAYRDFMSAIHHEIAAGLNISHMSLTGDLSQTSYSSGRIGLLQERDGMKRLQQYLVDHVCWPVYRAWFQWSVLRGALTISPPVVTAWSEIHWQTRAFPWVDPTKEMEAAKMEVALGLTSHERLASERGTDFYEVLTELSNEAKAATAAGVVLGDAPPEPAAPEPPPMEDDA